MASCFYIVCQKLPAPLTIPIVSAANSKQQSADFCCGKFCLMPLPPAAKILPHFQSYAELYLLRKVSSDKVVYMHGIFYSAKKNKNIS